MSTLKPTGSTSQWRTIRNKIIKRDLGLCVICQATGTDVDHIIPRSQGGTDDPDNLRLLCKTCHNRKTATDNTRGVFLTTSDTPDPSLFLLSPTTRLGPPRPVTRPDVANG